MYFADSHCHPHLAPLDANTDAVIAHARAAGVDRMLCVAVSLADIPVLGELCGRHRELSMSVGVHPNEEERATPSVEELVRLGQAPQVVAIGETGLDYYRSPAAAPWQQLRFRRHIQAARLLKKPLIIHTRSAAEDTLRLLEEEGAGEVGGVMHCFTENEEIARRALALGFYISFSGILTFKTAESLRAVASIVPLDRILIETDSPYLAPVPHRGAVNEPALVLRVAECLATVRAVPIEDVAAITHRNYLRLFHPVSG